MKRNILSAAIAADGSRRAYSRDDRRRAVLGRGGRRPVSPRRHHRRYSGPVSATRCLGDAAAVAAFAGPRHRHRAYRFPAGHPRFRKRRKAIRPSQPGVRLPSAELPGEIRPLVLAINNALERLEAGYRQQHEFAADAAHELRSPGDPAYPHQTRWRIAKCRGNCAATLSACRTRSISSSKWRNRRFSSSVLKSRLICMRSRSMWCLFSRR